MTSWAWPGQEDCLKRINAKAGASLSQAVLEWSATSPDPRMAVTHLEQWLGAVSNPGTAAQQFLSIPLLGRVFLKVLGSSSELGACLVQNPELASLILDPCEIGRFLTAEKLVESGRRLLESASSYTHRLDRLRFLKQESLIRIAAADKAGVWDPEQVWQSLSELADSLILLARDVAWDDYRADRGLPEACPLNIVGMGKLGGRELNYSSDIDLVYFTSDEADDALLKHSMRFAEKLNRALSDRMGRGILFRVDMRLRPYGRSGDLVIRQKAVEGYMDRYAEAWEHMALIRSRVVAGTEEAITRWGAMRRAYCFDRLRGEWQIESILAMRQRLEEKSTDRDLKRSPGGIRDVEFAVQILQLIHGSDHEALQDAGTLPVVAELARLELVPEEAARDLRVGYLFLRAVEHQLQVEGGRQTHDLPAEADSRRILARRMGFHSLSAFNAALDQNKSRVRHWYETLLGRCQTCGHRTEVLERFEGNPSDLAPWIDSLSDSESLWSSLAENESSLARVSETAKKAPALLQWLKKSDSVTEQILTGEILEDPSPPSLPLDGPRLRTRWLRAASRSALLQPEAFPHEFGQTCEFFLSSLVSGMAEPLTVVALGSFAERQLTLHSDLDIVLLATDEGDHAKADRAARLLVQKVSDIRVQDSPVALDLRLRPEGRQGLLYTTLASLKTYAATRMEPWERLATSRSRLVCGSPELFENFQRTVTDFEFTAEFSQSLFHIKSRVEHERAAHREGHVDIKLGPGGLDDVIWTIHLLALHTGHLSGDRSNPALAAELVKRQVLKAEEGEFLTRHFQNLCRARTRLGLAGLADSILPLDADTLSRLGMSATVVDDLAKARSIFEERAQGLVTR